MPDTVRPIAESFVGRLREPCVQPDEVSPLSGASLPDEADVVIARTATAANFSVTLTWSMGETEAPGGDTRPGS
ncbi:CU044_2847 family protein [Streptomyces sp. NPDC006551]|uniref:CU044_2847 family protein n=1 Tax=Streptomyces sp. NPDC006551 TaxID=3157178 RepID=UPI0033B19BBF